MKIVRHISVTDAILSSSNVVETPPAAYNAGTTYATGNQVSVFGGPSNTTATLYESLQDSNTGNTPASSPAWWQPIGTAYLAYSGATSYAADAIVTDTTNHKLYQSLFGSNSGNALTDTDWWLELGPSNRWAMFDMKTGTQTTRPLSVSSTLDVSGRIDTVALFNLDGASVNVTMLDGATEVHNEDYSLVSTDGIADWFSYFFEPIVRKTELLVTGLPNTLDPSLTATVTDTDNVSVGAFVAGLALYVGATQYGARVGITDFSRKTQDDFGNWYIVERSYAKRGNFTVWIEQAYSDQIFNTLSSYRATPLALIGADEFASTYYYGILKDWNIEISYPSHHIATIEVEGL